MPGLRPGPLRRLYEGLESSYGTERKGTDRGDPPCVTPVKHVFLEIVEAAAYLGISPDELARKARRGDVPAQSRGGRWVFPKEEIDHWVERRIGSGTAEQVRQIERTHGRADGENPLIVATVLRPEAVDLAMSSRTRASILRDLVGLADKTGLVYEPDTLRELVEEREGMVPTAIEGGVALPHPRRPDRFLAEESFIAFGHTRTGIPFGAPDGRLTDLFFLIVSRDDRFHLSVLARLTRMLSSDSFRAALRDEDEPDEALQAIAQRERDVTAS